MVWIGGVIEGQHHVNLPEPVFEVGPRLVICQKTFDSRLIGDIYTVVT